MKLTIILFLICFVASASTFTKSCPSASCIDDIYKNENLNKSDLINAFKKMCDDSIPGGCFHQGYLLDESGTALKVELYDKSCRLGYFEGCVRSSFIKNKYNPEKGLEVYKKYCKRKNVNACHFAGAYYLLNDNERQAVEFYGKACRLGSKDACNLNQIIKSKRYYIYNQKVFLI